MTQIGHLDTVLTQLEDTLAHVLMVSSKEEKHVLIWVWNSI